MGEQDHVPASRGPTDTLVAAIQGLRPRQWTKNGLVFAALIFSISFLDVGKWVETIIAFFAFSLISSSGYLLNDARDIEADRAHPTKRNRPIASGRLPLTVAYVEMVTVFVIGCSLALYLSPWLLLVVVLYFAQTVAYSLFFKHVVILDVMFIAAGFLWRAAAGAVAIDVVISPWLLMCTAFLALFLGFNKRRGEMVKMADKASSTRKNLADYSPEFVVEIQAVTTSGTIISYALYTVLASPTPWLLVTLPYVIYFVFRYIFLVTVRQQGAAPDETLVRDKPILIAAAMYAITVVVVLMIAPLKPH